MSVRTTAGAESSDPRAGKTRLQYWGPAIAASLGMFIGVVDSTLMNVAIPAIVVDLDTTVSVVQGAIAFYSLVIAALILPGGALPSMYGVRRLMTVTLVVYGLGTGLAAVSWNVGVLYLGWSLIEGAAAAVLLPLTFTILVVNYEGTDRAKALGVLAGVNAAGAAVGPILGGALTTFASWRWGFALEVVIVVVAIGFARYLGTERVTERRGSFDVGGTVLSVVGLVAIVAGFLLAGRHGWLLATRPFVVAGVQFTPFGTSPAIWFVCGGLLTLAGFVQYERRVERAGGTPLVPVAVLLEHRYTAGVLTFSVRSVVLAGFIFVVPVYLQSGLGYTAFQAGLAMLPFSVATLLASMFTTGLRTSVSPKTLVQFGIVLIGVGLMALAGQTAPGQTIGSMALPMTVVGLGLGLMMAQIVDMTLSAVPRTNSAEASGVLNATGMLGYALGTAIIGSFLLERYYRGVVDTVFEAEGVTLAAEQRNALARTVQDAAETATAATQEAVMSGLSPAERDVLALAFEAAIYDAQRAALVLLVAFTVLTLLVSTLLPRKSPIAESDAGATETPTGPEPPRDPSAEVSEHAEDI